MREPTFRRSRFRQQRLIRLGIVAVLLLGAITLVANLVGGGGAPGPGGEEIAQVSFRTKAIARTDAGGFEGPRTVPRGRVAQEEDAIREMLNAWYQQTFVDPAVFTVSTSPGDGVSFPPASALALFTEEARTDVVADVDSLTLGAERTGFARVDPTRARATIAIFFEGGDKPMLATASVVFEATASPAGAGEYPVTVSQHADLHFERSGNGWLISYYQARQKQDSDVPASPSGGPGGGS
ncbi:MAG TPA: hypothetical protein VGB83_08170 [Actinomycetota bacterium]